MSKAMYADNGHTVLFGTITSLPFLTSCVFDFSSCVFDLFLNQTGDGNVAHATTQYVLRQNCQVFLGCEFEQYFGAVSVITHTTL